MVKTILLILILYPSFIRGQEGIDKAIEYLQKFSIEEIDWENTAVTLEKFIQEPLIINNLSYESIQEFPLLNSRHFFVIKKYKKLNGTIFTINELLSLPFFTSELISILIPFVNFKAKKKEFRPRGYLMHKTSFNLEPNKGLRRKDENGFLGGKTQETTRFKLTNQKHNFTFTWEKDQGEKFKNSFSKIAYQANLTNKLKQINVGAYSLNIGEGLIHSNNFIVGKNNPLHSFYKIQRSLKINSSSTEYNYENGLAFVYQIKKMKTTCFYSTNKLNGNKQNDTLKSIKQDGLFRTNNEISYRKNANYKLFGSIISYERKKTSISYNTLILRLSKPYEPSPKYYNINYSIHKLMSNSINYRFFTGDKICKGELAFDKKGNIATTHFFVVNLNDAFSLMANTRYLSPKYKSFRSNTLSENSRTQNEKALLIAGNYEVGKTQIYASADFFSFPAPKYLVQLPSYGKEFMSYFNYQITDSLSIKLFFKQESKDKNQKSSFLNEPKRYSISHIYGKMVLKAHKNLTIETRLDFSAHKTGGINSFGRTSYLEICQKSERNSFSARIVFFKTDNWDTRIYLYEKDVLYHFSVPALYDMGTRFFINYNRKIGKHVRFWLKYGRTIFENKSSISSGNNEINGNLKTEIRSQIQIKF